MRKITEISEIQELLLLMLKYFDSLCREHGLSYVMLGGTMLGAVRHKGFIPWDDDVDVGMPRPDYDRFLSLMETEKGRYFCVTREKDPADPHLFAKLVDSKTKAVERLAAGVENYGLFIDVFPVDGLGKTKEEALKTAEGVFFYRSRFLDSECNEIRGSLPKRIVKRMIRPFLPPEKSLAKIEALRTSCSYEEAEWCGNVLGGRWKEKEVSPKYIFADRAEYDFSGCKFYGTAHYDEFLRQLYGDYMKLPPEDERMDPHLLELWEV